MFGRLITCVGIMTATALFAVTACHAATFEVCNKAKELVSVAIGYDDKDLGMLSEGWWKLAIGDCVNIVPADQKEHQYYFLYARGERGGNWSSFDSAEEGAFCVRNGNFRLINRDVEKTGKLECQRRRASLIKFRRIDTFVGGKAVPKFVYNLTQTSD